ncbi:DUF624 domain-containing protein [Virgibacillus sp. C22-A2]|uniref:DUF624 domain-containing protein n=1 Tax=Virgibacillus tibetensis TaxID=3042313 RepID=A0ABU6KCZ1_9BACI|nr:DUF624 domain-containing protein [Virgibacillus sp. C22-A2]
MLESRFYKILDEVTSIVIINFLFLISSLFIVTFFPALFSMISTVRNKFHKESSEIVRFFFQELWKYRMSANIIGIPAILIGYSFFYYINAFYAINTTWSLYLLPLSIMIFIAYLFFTMQAIFNIIHFDMPMKMWLKNALFMVFYKPQFTIILSIYFVLILLLTYWFQILLFLGTFSLLMYGLVYISLKKISTIKVNE